MADHIGRIDAMLIRAAELTDAGQPRAAIALLLPLVASWPDHSPAWCRLAAAHLDAGQPTESLDAAKRAIALGERSWAHRLASLALVELGRVDEAVVSAREAVRRDPVDWRCHVALAEALAADAPEEAVLAARRAVELAPHEARPSEVLGDVAALVPDHALARDAYRAAARLDPRNDEIRAKLSGLGGPGRVRTTAHEPVRRRRRPSPPAPAGPQVRFGRVQQTAMWLVLSRGAIVAVVGSLLLLVAGMPAADPLLAWFGAGLVVVVGVVTWHAWRRMPAEARVAPGVAVRVKPLLLPAAGLLAAGLLVVLMWTVAVVLGGTGTRLLIVALGLSAACAVVCWAALRRLRGGGREPGEK